MKKILNLIGRGFKYVFISIFTFLDSIKMFFVIPLLSVASSIFALSIIFLIQPLITQLPGFLGEGFIQTILGGSIFIILSVMIFNDKLNKNLSFDFKSYLISFNIALLIWIIPVFILYRQGSFLGDFYAEEYLDFMSAFDSISTFFYLGLLSPHFYIATITKEYVFSVALGLIVNGTIFSYISLNGIYGFGKKILLKTNDEKLDENDY